MPSSDAMVTVVEGMPGAGKTTLLAALARVGHTVLGEYTTDDGELLAHPRHPHHRDEDGHLANWLCKSAQLRRLTGAVWVDRDWLTALAFAASTGGLSERAAWAHGHLSAGRLVLPLRWIVLDLPPNISLQRRHGRQEAGHPWSDTAVLDRLRAFYRDPAAALDGAHPGLAARIATVPLSLVDGAAGPGELVRVVELAGDR
ncbi:AAA family ATPase [Streptomyces sp. B1866]|uniref:AAA family ATPase n=1 Tax=Streptomyces sp. B1866 TaxID=3075431 RepID=UPI00288F51D9|nr:AAA family ATPase [Streptomyces sp. B1866]MDT3398296.1 AAA family ATPase [Streptomyces sp. B1866]